MALSLTIGLAVAPTGCSSTQPVGVQIDDSVVTAKVKSKFAGDPEVSAMNIDVDTSEGVVTLNGRVSSVH